MWTRAALDESRGAGQGFSASAMFDVIFLLVTAAIAYHGLTWRDEEGESDVVRLLFGSIALLFFFRVLLVDVLGVWG